MARRTLSILAAIFIACGLAIGIGVSSPPAHATSSFQYCDPSGHCINAWNGGPQVNAYRNGVVNNNFDMIPYPPGGQYAWVIQSQTTGTYVGDYGNSQSSARAGLVGYGGWGTIFYRYPGYCNISGEAAFWNPHWQAWFSSNSTNGAPYYLNTGNKQCFSTDSGA